MVPSGSGGGPEGEPPACWALGPENIPCRCTTSDESFYFCCPCRLKFFARVTGCCYFSMEARPVAPPSLGKAERPCDSEQLRGLQGGQSTKGACAERGGGRSLPFVSLLRRSKFTRRHHHSVRVSRSTLCRRETGRFDTEHARVRWSPACKARSYKQCANTSFSGISTSCCFDRFVVVMLGRVGSAAVPGVT